MVTPTGFEPVTCPLGGGCSIQLSHGAAKIRYLQYFFCEHSVCQLFANFHQLITENTTDCAKRKQLLLGKR